MNAHLPLMPVTRGGCADVPRPCRFTACRYSLASPDPQQGALFSLEPVGPIRPSCALDVADENPDGLTVEELAAAFGEPREGVRLELEAALLELRRRMPDDVAAGMLDVLRG